MKTSLIVSSLIICVTAIIFTMLLIPPEDRLGTVIRWVFLHAALVQTGMVWFFIAGIIGIGTLFLTRLTQSLKSSQLTAFFIWILYIFSSMWVTRLAWGQWIAWEEPRVRASFIILAVLLLFILSAEWIKISRFRAVFAIFHALIAWTLVKQSAMIRHPFDPIGSSSHEGYQIAMLILTALVMISSGLLTWLFFKAIRIDPLK